MAYTIKALPKFADSAFEADAYLFFLNEKAADEFYLDYMQKVEQLRKFPRMYKEFEDDNYFRSIPLVYDYRLFYHIDEENHEVILHRIIRGMMDLASQLYT